MIVINLYNVQKNIYQIYSIRTHNDAYSPYVIFYKCSEHPSTYFAVSLHTLSLGMEQYIAINLKTKLWRPLSDAEVGSVNDLIEKCEVPSVFIERQCAELR